MRAHNQKLAYTIIPLDELEGALHASLLAEQAEHVQELQDERNELYDKREEVLKFLEQVEKRLEPYVEGNKDEELHELIQEVRNRL